MARNTLPDDYEPSLRVGRKEFLTEIWDHKPGQHVTLIAPTQNGKTTLIWDLLEHLPEQKNPPIMLVMKPQDEVVERGRKRLKWIKVTSWPPTLTRFALPNPPGYVLWPKHTFDVHRDDVILHAQMHSALTWSYKRGKQVVVADETYGLIKDLHLERELSAIHTRGAGMGTSLWCATQKPAFAGSWLYSQAEYLFLGYDPDKNVRDRLEEIGGFDSGVVAHEVKNLGKFEWLFLQRTGRKRCIIAAS